MAIAAPAIPGKNLKTTGGSRFKQRSVLPGFGLSLGFSVVYLSLIVLIPLSTIFLKTATMSWHSFWSTVTDPETVAAYKLTFGASLAAALVNVVFGLLVAWVLARYSFFGKRIVDGLVDLPFALPTAVAGIALAAVYSQNGPLGRFLVPHGIDIVFHPSGVFVALVFVSLPYVVRTTQPVIQELEAEVEEAAASLGASRLQTFVNVLLPTILPAVITGFSLSFARAIGEYGSVVFISNNIPFQGEIVPQLIINKLNDYDYPEATAIALVMLVASFVLLLTINSFQRWTSKHHQL